MVYIGFPSKDVIINDKNDFIYLLCMFVALELITFSYFKEKYLMVKNIFDTPKFEDGLTNTFIHPSRLFDHFQIGINQVQFCFCFDTFYSHL